MEYGMSQYLSRLYHDTSDYIEGRGADYATVKDIEALVDSDILQVVRYKDLPPYFMDNALNECCGNLTFDEVHLWTGIQVGPLAGA